MAPQSARRDRKTSAFHSASEHAWVMWIRFANSHTGQRHCDRKNRPDRWQHPTTANTRFYSCIFWGVHRWEADMGLLPGPSQLNNFLRYQSRLIGFALSNSTKHCDDHRMEKMDIGNIYKNYRKKFCTV